MNFTIATQFIASLLIWCSIASDSHSDQKAASFFDIEFGRSTTIKERDTFLQTLGSLEDRHLVVDPSFVAFQHFFKLNDMSGVREYLKNRMQVVLSPSVHLDIQTPEAAVDFLPVMHSTQNVLTQNPSLLFWIAQRWNKTEIDLDGILIPPTKQPKFIQTGSDFGKYFPLYGLSILVHEAKHSDCSDGLTDEKLVEFKNSKDLQELALKLANEACGFSHSVCPEDNPNAGRMSCDSSFEGPYAAQYVFNRAIVKYCTDCSFGEKALLQIFAVDAASRMPLPEPYATTMNRMVEQMPDLQRNTTPQEFVEKVLESILLPVDAFLNKQLEKPQKAQE